MVVFLLLSLLLDYYYYHYNILLRFLYFGEEEMATQQPPGVEAAKTASVFDVLLLRRFLFSAFGRRWPRAPTFYSENFCPTRLPSLPILGTVWKKNRLSSWGIDVKKFLISYIYYFVFFTKCPFEPSLLWDLICLE